MIITLSNGKEEVVIGNTSFKLLKRLDFSGLGADVRIVETGSDGGLFLSSRYNTRDIDIEGYIDCTNKDPKWIQTQKDTLYRICNPKEEIDITVEENGEQYFMKAHPIVFPIFKNDRKNANYAYQTFFLQFVCADPHLYKNQKIVTFANVTPLFSFPLDFTQVVFGEARASLIESIYNDGIMDCPLEIHMTSLQVVTNPYLLNVYTQEKIKLNTQLITGDEIIINTGRKKEVSRIRNGVKTSFYWSLDLNSSFLQLTKGDNIFRFGADAGEDFLQIEIRYQERMGGI